MQEYTIQIKLTLLRIALLTVVLSLVAVQTGHAMSIPGLLLGTFASVVYFLLMCYRVKRSAGLPPEQAVMYMRSGWIIRLSFIVLILILSLQIKQIDFLAAVVGVFSLHIVSVLNAFVFVAKTFIKKQQR